MKDKPSLALTFSVQTLCVIFGSVHLFKRNTFIFTILPTVGLAVRIIINQEDNKDNVLVTTQANYKTSEMPLRVLFYQMLIILN